MSDTIRMALPMFDAAFNLQRQYLNVFKQTAMMFQPSMGGMPSPSMPTYSVSKPVKFEGGEEGVIAVGEEVLQVGKQLIHGDTTRVVRTVVESPVEENIELVTETVVVERRPATQAASDALSNRTIEMTSTSERPVVSKARRLVEEVVLRRETTKHIETVRDTVKRDQIDVQQPNRLPAVIAQPRDDLDRRDHKQGQQQSRAKG
jgi:uncharacterized protein (TIGR02271 family)